jgi:hypothetical protein
MVLYFVSRYRILYFARQYLPALSRLYYPSIFVGRNKQREDSIPLPAVQPETVAPLAMPLVK